MRCSSTCAGMPLRWYASPIASRNCVTCAVEWLAHWHTRPLLCLLLPGATKSFMLRVAGSTALALPAADASMLEKPLPKPLASGGTGASSRPTRRSCSRSSRSASLLIDSSRWRSWLLIASVRECVSAREWESDGVSSSDRSQAKPRTDALAPPFIHSRALTLHSSYNAAPPLSRHLLNARYDETFRYARSSRCR